jgi:hypothetical protein
LGVIGPLLARAPGRVFVLTEVPESLWEAALFRICSNNRCSVVRMEVPVSAHNPQVWLHIANVVLPSVPVSVDVVPSEGKPQICHVVIRATEAGASLTPASVWGDHRAAFATLIDAKSTGSSVQPVV